MSYSTSMKICCQCKEPKPISEFHKEKKNKDGLTYACKDCRNAKYKSWYKNNPSTVRKIIEDGKEYRKKYYQRPEIKRKYKLRDLLKSYGLSENDYNKLLNEQVGVCAICKCDEKSTRNKHLSVDHCHETGKVRGLLCSACNRGIGLLGENLNTLQLAINYLKTK